MGKSTWINAVMNYLVFSNLEEASQNDLRYLIPTKFTLVNEKNERQDISIGSSENECTVKGQGATQEPRSYQFQVDDKSIRIIDTPGINDPKGTQQDNVNVDNTLKFISSFPEIHGICILLKPNVARLSPAFRYCLFEFLTHLHSSAVDNLIFCFTNTRSTFYKPGDTLTPLEVLVGEINQRKTSTQLELVLSDHTMYCLDNEAFRFLCALHKGVQFKNEIFKDFSSSWNTSKNETLRMLKHVEAKKPHETKSTMKINEANRIILTLAGPMNKIRENIDRNIRLANEQKDRISQLDAKNLKLKGELMFDYIQLIPVDIDHPKTVCHASKCIEKRGIPGTKNETTTIYKTVCHAHCYLPDVPTETVGAAQLERCKAMKTDGTCGNCGCQWQMHLHITYDMKEQLVKVINEDIQELMNQNLSAKAVQKALISKLEANIEQYKKEREDILDIGSRFGSFLRHHSILPYNDAIEEHIRIQRDDAKKDAMVTGSYDKVNALETLLYEYLEKKSCLEEWINKNNTPISLDEIPVLRDRLMKLVNTGQCFQECFETAANAQLQLLANCGNTVQPVVQSNPTTQFQRLKQKAKKIVSTTLGLN